MPYRPERPSIHIELSDDGELKNSLPETLSEDEVTVQLFRASQSSNENVRALYQELIDSCILYAELHQIKKSSKLYRVRTNAAFASVAEMRNGNISVEAVFWLWVCSTLAFTGLGAVVTSGNYPEYLNNLVQIGGIPTYYWLISNIIHPLRQFKSHAAEKLLGQLEWKKGLGIDVVEAASAESETTARNLLTLLLRELGDYRVLPNPEKYLRGLGRYEHKRKQNEDKLKLKNEKLVEEENLQQRDKETERQKQIEAEQQKEQQLERLRQNVLNNHKRH